MKNATPGVGIGPNCPWLDLDVDPQVDLALAYHVAEILKGVLRVASGVTGEDISAASAY
jgi:hypothetical protein